MDRVTVASRAFTLAGVLGLSATTGSGEAIQMSLLVGAVAATASGITLRTSLPNYGVAVGEALIVGLLVGATFPLSVVILPYLAIPGLIAGIAGGVKGVVGVVIAEASGLVAIGALSGQPGGQFFSARDWEIVSPWVATSLGVGLLGSFLRQMGKVPHANVDESYLSAHRLVTQLRLVARRLSEGLDPLNMATETLRALDTILGPAASALFVRTEGGVLVPLAYHGPGSDSLLLADDPAVTACWEEMEPRHNDLALDATSRTAFPLKVGARMIGVVLTDSAVASRRDTREAVGRELGNRSLHLDTALVFDEVRSIATVEERRRLSREIHDGIAQEVASLGYLVDDLAAAAESDDQRAQLRDLRAELTRVVSELRLSIFDLRSEVTAASGLGSALSEYVRQLGSRSNLTVHLTLDEAPTRLRSNVEMELLRIAQEALTNARKHSGASNLWVNCRVRPPFASLEIRDDGSGIRKSREDSYGVKVMRERAARIGALLSIEDCSQLSAVQRGTVVRISLGQGPAREFDSAQFSEEASHVR